MWDRLFGGKSGDKGKVSETAIITGETNMPAHRVARQLDSLLDQVIGLFPSGLQMMAEVMLALPDGSVMVTVRLRPDTSVALFFCLRAGEGIAGEVLRTGEAFAATVTPQDQVGRATSSPKAVAHLLSTRSVLAMPLLQGKVCLGVLNVECPQLGVFDAASLHRLQESGLPAQIAETLARMQKEPPSHEEIVASILDNLRERVAFAINPDDMTDTYYQLLRLCVQVVRPTGVSGGLILVRDERSALAYGTSATDRRLYAVRAARVGAFNSDTEWELLGQSIERRVILNRRGELINNVHHDPDYRDSGTGWAEASELIVPLLDGSAAVGVIRLVAPGKHAFDESDLANLEVVAEVAVYAVKRTEELRSNRRRSQQLECSRTVLDLLAPLFPREAHQITRKEISRVRDVVSTQILTWATEFTDSEHGAFVLAETNERGETNLVIHENRTPDPVPPGAPPRWPANEGVTGEAYASDSTSYVPDLAEVGRHYIPYFPNVRSEVASPLKIGDAVLGVLNVESKRAHHFTSDHLDWIEFLAQQAAFALSTIDHAMQTFIESALADVSLAIDNGIDLMRQRTNLRQLPAEERDPRKVIPIVRGMREALVRRVIEALLPLTGSWVGRFLFALNAYDREDEVVNLRRGSLFYLVSTDPHEEETDFKDRHFPLSAGISGLAFKTQHQIVFNDLASRPAEFFDSSPVRNSRSGISIPVWEGTRISGILNIESEHEGAFSTELIRACQVAADLTSKIVTTARSRILTLLRQQMREFEPQILRLQSADLDEFMQLVLTDAADLAYISEGWGMMVLVRDPAPSGSLLLDKRFSMTYGPGESQFVASEGERLDLHFPLFLEAMQTQQPVLVPDSNLGASLEWQGAPWPPEARSMVLVPLLRPGKTWSAVDSVGVLALAHRTPGEFSDDDKETLAQFAEWVTVGLHNILLLQRMRLRKDRPIFISYRRMDSAGTARHMYDLLVDHFGQDRVLIDVEDIPPVEDFHEYVTLAVKQSSIVLALIGPMWLTARDDAGNRRLDDAEDLVRLEIETALRGNIPILPILIDGTTMPGAEDLPKTMERLAHIQAVLLRNSSDFSHDVQRIMHVIEQG